MIKLYSWFNKQWHQKRYKTLLSILILSFLISNSADAQNQIERLERGAALASDIILPSTTSCAVLTGNLVTATLSAGVTNARLETTNANGLANIDYFKVTVADPQAVSITSSIRIAACNEGINNIQKTKDVFSFPNPSKKAFLVKVNGTFEFTIMDNFAHQMERGEGIIQTMAEGNLIPGVYMLKVQTHKGSKNIKIIKQ